LENIRDVRLISKNDALIRRADAPRVLIVDDSVEQIALLDRVLTAQGYRCVSVTDGRHVFDICAGGGADVVLTDLNMPDVDGLTVCRQLKAAPETCLIPVLIMTGDANRQSHLQALEAGADDFLMKPLALPELRARVGSAIKVKQYIDELDNAAASIVALGATIEARDRYTNGHCQRLAEYAAALGMRVGIDRSGIRALEQGGYVHDLGKIAIPDAVLFKSGALTADEYELVKSHPVVGDRICAPLRTLDRVRSIVRSHHELLDGRGYPDGLRGAAVPLPAQIVGVADVYDALTSDRSYRRALAPSVALQMLFDEARAGKRDLALIEEFVGVVTDADVTAADESRPAIPPAPALGGTVERPLALLA
jgi:putative two-component system response regulator